MKLLRVSKGIILFLENDMEESKHVLRDEFKKKRLDQSEDECRRKSKIIIEKIRKLDIYHNSKTVAIYHPVFNEVDLLELLNDDKTFCFPKIISLPNAEMDFFEVGPGFKESIYGIGEPEGNYVGKNNIDLILVPGLVFSKSGYRIGYGKGFYDKYLNDFGNPTIGIAYDFQVIDELPHGDRDVRLSMIITSVDSYV